MPFYRRRSEYVQKRELFVLGIFCIALEFIVGIFTTGWLLDVTAVVALVGVVVFAHVLHRRRSRAADPAL